MCVHVYSLSQQKVSLSLDVEEIACFFVKYRRNIMGVPVSIFMFALICSFATIQGFDIKETLTCGVMKTMDLIGKDPAEGTFNIEMVISKIKCGVSFNFLEILILVIIPITLIASIILCCCWSRQRAPAASYVRSYAYV